MKIRYASSNGQLIFESDVANPKEAVEWLSTVQELFEETTCGICGQSHVAYEVREFDGNNYYKMVCRDCHATLDFGQRRDGTNLFIKRRDAEGAPLPNRGWYRYQPNSPKPSPSTSTRAPRNAETPRRNVEQAQRAESVPF